ncbi:MAG: PIN domain-containing protein [Acidobacteriota bacterium]
MPSGLRLAIVDAGPLYAVTDTDDADHVRCRRLLERPDLHLVLPALVITEVTYLIGKRLGAGAEAAFLRGLDSLDVAEPQDTDWPRMAELVERYRDFPLGGTDASVIALAERLDTSLVLTLDHRHFGAVKPKHCPKLELLPELD